MTVLAPRDAPPPRSPVGRHAAEAPSGRRAAVVLAVVAVLAGLVLLVLGPGRSFLQTRQADARASRVATDATCFRFGSLETRVAEGRVRVEELRRRGSDLAIGAEGADGRVAAAAQRLADELRTDQLRVDGDAWTELANACGRA